MAKDDDELLRSLTEGGIGDGDFGQVPIVGGPLNDVTGYAARKGDAEAREAEQNAMGEVQSLKGEMPSLRQLAGTGYAMDMGGHELGPSQAGQATADADSIAAQDMALSQMQEVARHRGMTPADRLRLQQAQNSNAQAMARQREGIMQGAQMRGVGGSGLEFAQVLGAGQQGANALAAENASLQQAAQTRALQAMQASGGLATQQRGQSFGESYGRGQAVDAFNRDNVQYRRDITRDNLGRINQQVDNVRGAHRDRYGMREGQAAMATGQYNQQQQSAEQRAQASRERLGNYATGTAKIIKGDPL